MEERRHMAGTGGFAGCNGAAGVVNAAPHPKNFP